MRSICIVSFAYHCKCDQSMKEHTLKSQLANFAFTNSPPGTNVGSFLFLFGIEFF